MSSALEGTCTVSQNVPSQCTWKTFKIHQTFVRWAFNILFKFVKSLIRHFGPSHRKCPMCPMIFMNTAFRTYNLYCNPALGPPSKTCLIKFVNTQKFYKKNNWRNFCHGIWEVTLHIAVWFRVISDLVLMQEPKLQNFKFTSFVKRLVSRPSMICFSPPFTSPWCSRGGLADSSLSNQRASLNRSLNTDLSVNKRMHIDTCACLGYVYTTCGMSDRPQWLTPQHGHRAVHWSFTLWK